MPFSVSTGVLGQLIGSLLQGADNKIEQLVMDKIEGMGRNVIADLIRLTPLGAGVAASQSIMADIQSGGSKEFNRARSQWLNTLQRSGAPPGLSRLSGKIQRAFDKTAREISEPNTGHWKWSKSRKEWMNEDWKHDWRSQPRDLIGRWTKGRLKTIFVSPRAKKVRSARRRAVRKQVREMMRGR